MSPCPGLGSGIIWHLRRLSALDGPYLRLRALSRIRTSSPVRFGCSDIDCKPFELPRDGTSGNTLTHVVLHGLLKISVPRILAETPGGATSREEHPLAAERRPSPGDTKQVVPRTNQRQDVIEPDAPVRFDDPIKFGDSGKVGDHARLRTSVPKSREQATEKGLDARAVGTASMMIEEETGERPTVSQNFTDRANPNSEDKRRWSSYAPPPESFREAPTEPAEAPEPQAEALVSEPQLSAGFYSVRPPRHSGVEIPRAPRLPRDLAGIEEHTQTYRVARAPRVDSERAPSVPPCFQPRSDSAYPETIRTPPPDADVPSERSRRRSSAPPPPMQEAHTLAPPPPDFTGERRSSYPAPRLYFAPHVRSQAKDWARTGSLSLPGCSSPRHARALQRALLLALLHELGWEAIPQGLRQRVGWLFCEGWESNSTDHALRELDDLATVLGLPSGADSRKTLSMALAGVLPKTGSPRPLS